MLPLLRSQRSNICISFVAGSPTSITHRRCKSRTNTCSWWIVLDLIMLFFIKKMFDIRRYMKMSKKYSNYYWRKYWIIIGGIEDPNILKQFSYAYLHPVKLSQKIRYLSSTYIFNPKLHFFSLINEAIRSKIM